jgi:hypothetical protein
MKLTFRSDSRARFLAGKLGLGKGRFSLAHARSQLESAVGEVLAGSLEVLGERWFAEGAGSPRASAPVQRMRNVIEMDRVETVRAQSPSAVSEKALEPDTSERAEATVATEPIRTRTMARLLAAQGYRKRALAMYDELLAAKQDDAELRDEAERLRSSR